MAYDATDFVVTETPAPVRDPKSITDPRERVAYLSAFLRALPVERFDMTNFAIVLDDDGEGEISAERIRTDCGTAACIAGWCEALFTDERHVGGTHQARWLLGLSDDASTTLFYANSEGSPLNTYWGATPTQAANVLDHYLATGEIDWSVA